MSTIDASVTAGYTFTDEDAQHNILVTKDRLNLLGKPTATVDISGAIAAADLKTDAVETAKIKDLNVTTGKIAASAVTAAKLADAVADLIPYVTVTAAAELGNQVVVTVQLKDVQANSLASRFQGTFWLSDDSGGSPSYAVYTASSVSVATTVGAVTALVANEYWRVISDANGAMSIGFTYTVGALVKHIIFEFNGLVYTAKLTWAA